MKKKIGAVLAAVMLCLAMPFGAAFAAVSPDVDDPSISGDQDDNGGQGGAGEGDQDATGGQGGQNGQNGQGANGSADGTSSPQTGATMQYVAAGAAVVLVGGAAVAGVALKKSRKQE